MKLFFKNGVYASLSLSRIFNTLGASIFNIVFVVFASSMPNPKFAIAVANFIVLVPTFFTIFAGIKADKPSLLPSLSAFSVAWPDKLWEFGS